MIFFSSTLDIFCEYMLCVCLIVITIICVCRIKNFSKASIIAFRNVVFLSSGFNSVCVECVSVFPSAQSVAFL